MSVTNYFLIMLAIALVESGGNDYAVGENGEIGRLQTKAIVVRDINRIYGTHYHHQDCVNYNVSLDIFNRYQNYYLRKLDKPFTLENMCLLWNGGPDLDGSKRYVKKVRKKYEELLKRT